MYHGPGPYGFQGATAPPQPPAFPPAQFPPYPQQQSQIPSNRNAQKPGSQQQESCYNCGNGSHWAQNCHEPRRAVPAGSLRKQQGRLNRGAAPPALNQPIVNTRPHNPQQPYPYNSPSYGSPQSYGPPTPVSGYAPPPHGMPSPSAYSFSPVTTPGASFSPHQTGYPWSAPATPYAAQHNSPPLAHGPFPPHSQTPSPVTPSTPYGHHSFGALQQAHQPPPSRSPAPEKQKQPVMLSNAGAVWVPAQPTGRPLDATFRQSEARGPYMPPRLHTPGSMKQVSISVYIDHGTVEQVAVHISKTSEWNQAKQDPAFCLDLTDKRVSLDEMKRAVRRRTNGASSRSVRSSSPDSIELIKTVSHAQPIDALRIRTSPEPIVHALPPRPRNSIVSGDGKDKAAESPSYGWKQPPSTGADSDGKLSPSSPKNVRKISLSEYSKARKSSSASKLNENEVDNESAVAAQARHSAKSSTETLNSLSSSNRDDTPPTSAMSTSTDLSTTFEFTSKAHKKHVQQDQDHETGFKEDGDIEESKTTLASFETTAMNGSRKRTRTDRESQDFIDDLGDEISGRTREQPSIKRVCS